MSGTYCNSCSELTISFKLDFYNPLLSKNVPFGNLMITELFNVLDSSIRAFEFSVIVLFEYLNDVY